MREAFALQLLTFFQQKYWYISDINFRTFNEALTNDIVMNDLTLWLFKNFITFKDGIECHYKNVLTQQ